MRKLAVALAAARLVTLALVAAVLRGPRSRRRKGVEPPRGTADLGGPVGRQHRPVCVPLARQAGHADDPQQLHPGRGPGSRAELLHVLADGAVRHLRRPQRRREARRLVLLPVQAEDGAVLPRRHVAAVHGHPRRWQGQGDRVAHGRRRPTTSARARRPDYHASPRRPSRLSPAAARCSPASGTIRSLRTSATSSTCSRSARARAHRRRARTSSPATPCTRSLADPDLAGRHAVPHDRHLVGRRPPPDQRCRPGATGQWVQVSRLGNPLINEVVIPTGLKDLWNARARPRTRSSSSTTRRRSSPR